jgi:hypothetical protein
VTRHPSSWSRSMATNKLVKHWNHVSTDDPAFKTKEALGPGSTLAAFEQAFGPASRGEGEGGWYVNFRIGKSEELQVRDCEIITET